MNKEPCSQKSVGVLVWSLDRSQILLMERAKFPPGMAPPCGHADPQDVDVDGNFDPHLTALREVREEAGIELSAQQLKPLIEGLRMDGNVCSRGSQFHDYWVFEALIDPASTRLTKSEDEALNLDWYSRGQLSEFIADAGRLRHGINAKGVPIEDVWFDHFSFVLR